MLGPTEPRYQLEPAENHGEHWIAGGHRAELFELFGVDMIVFGKILMVCQQRGMSSETVGEPGVAYDRCEYSCEPQIVVGFYEIGVSNCAKSQYFDYFADVIGKKNFVDIPHHVFFGCGYIFIAGVETQFFHYIDKGERLVEFIVGIIGECGDICANISLFAFLANTAAGDIACCQRSSRIFFHKESETGSGNSTVVAVVDSGYDHKVFGVEIDFVFEHSVDLVAE